MNAGVMDVDQLSMAAFHFYPISELGLSSIRVEAGRGCPFQCTFCSTATFFGRKYRVKAAPKLVGESVGLHPVWLMFALFAFGYLLGFVGLLLAVPLAAIVGVLVRFALRRYLESPFYTGEPATGPVGFTSAKRGGSDPA